jgi:hypothetical protein
LSLLFADGLCAKLDDADDALLSGLPFPGGGAA